MKFSVEITEEDINEVLGAVQARSGRERAVKLLEIVEPLKPLKLESKWGTLLLDRVYLREETYVKPDRGKLPEYQKLLKEYEDAYQKHVDFRREYWEIKKAIQGRWGAKPLNTSGVVEICGEEFTCVCRSGKVLDTSKPQTYLDPRWELKNYKNKQGENADAIAAQLARALPSHPDRDFRDKKKVGYTTMIVDGRERNFKVTVASNANKVTVVILQWLYDKTNDKRLEEPLKFYVSSEQIGVRQAWKKEDETIDTETQEARDGNLHL